MRRIIIVLFFMTGFIPGAASAQRMLGPDTLYFKLRDEIVVTALRIRTPLANAPVPVDVIRREELQSAPGQSVSDVLRQSPGATVRAYGAGGALDLVSLRGLEAEYTVVLLDGVRMNNAQITVVDLDKISLSNIDQIEVVRGGYSSLYGADALGGIINIRTGGGALSPYLKAGAGSFGFRQYEGGAGLRIGTGMLSVSGWYEEADNDYPFTTPANVEETRARSNYTKKGASLHGMVAGSDYTASLYANAAVADAGTPGAMTGVHQGFARQTDRSAAISAPVQYQPYENLHLQATPSVLYAVQNYYDPALRIGGAPLDATYENTHFAFALTAEHGASSSLKMLYGAEAQYATLRSNEVSGTPERLSLGAFVTGEWSIESARVQISPALRGDLHRDLHNAFADERLSPSLGVQFKAVPEYATLRARAAGGYRIPTFNQLYWAQGGNPAVRPESSIALDAGVRLTVPSLTGVALDLGAFRHDIDDKIVWRPGSGIYWTPQNIRNAVSRGLEGAVSYFSPTLRFDLSGQWIRSQQENEDFPGDEKKGKQLIYVPEFSGALRTYWRPIEGVTVSVAGTYAGKRYYTSINDRFLEPYTSWDASAMYAVTLEGVEVLLKAEVLNVFDAPYEVTAFYPMPGRGFRFSMTTLLP